MTMHIRGMGNCKYEVWCEEGGAVISEAKILVVPGEVIVDSIETKPAHRRKGYATKLILEIQERLRLRITPFGVLPTAEAEGFWSSQGLRDVLKRSL